MSAVRAGIVEAHAAAIAAAGGPDAALAAVEALAADRQARTAEIRAVAQRVTGSAPAASARRADLLDALRRPHLDRLTAEAKDRAARSGGTL